MLNKFIQNQLRTSEIKNIDSNQYKKIAEYVFTNTDSDNLGKLNYATLKDYIKHESITKLSKTRRDKIEYVLTLIIDRANHRVSKKCEGIHVICNYCGANAKLSNRKKLYDNNIHLTKTCEKIYLCENYPECDAYVGVHKGDNWPLGQLANAPLRKLRNETHVVFDKIWRYGPLTRHGAYEFLQKKMELHEFQTHISKFDKEKCNRAILICRNYME